ncbi:hypothetical protein IAI18_16100 [Acetobacteraceae bacterium H6797]|nr:hypothetical protein [Acetobacteraceae bacterium H6797]
MNTSRAEAMGPAAPASRQAGGKTVAKTADFKRAVAQAGAQSNAQAGAQASAQTAARASVRLAAQPSAPGGTQPVTPLSGQSNAQPGVQSGAQVAAATPPGASAATSVASETARSAASGGLLLQASLGNAGNAPARPASAPQNQARQNSEALRSRLASAERSDGHPNQGYGLRNAGSGALGRYQLTPIALRDIGWQDAEGNWTAKAAAKGVQSEESFLASPAAQEAAMGDYLNRVETILASQGSLSRTGQAVMGTDGGDVPITRAGLLAAAHRRGAGAVAAWLDNRTNRPDAALSNAQKNVFASIEGRMRDFADLDAGTPGRALA